MNKDRKIKWCFLSGHATPSSQTAPSVSQFGQESFCQAQNMTLRINNKQRSHIDKRVFDRCLENGGKNMMKQGRGAVCLLV